MLIKISAKLNTGKTIGAKSMKSITYPCVHLSIPLPKVPASKKIIASCLEKGCTLFLYIQIISIIETNMLINDKKNV